MVNLGPGELLLILIVLALVFGASRLPALGDAIGRALRGRSGR
jgi:TatA/E family protein of Tat protein translocase